MDATANCDFFAPVFKPLYYRHCMWTSSKVPVTRSDINLRCFPVLSAGSYLKLLFNYIIYYHNFKCQIHLEAVQFDVAPMPANPRYRVTRS